MMIEEIRRTIGLETLDIDSVRTAWLYFVCSSANDLKITTAKRWKRIRHEKVENLQRLDGSPTSTSLPSMNYLPVKHKE